MSRCLVKAYARLFVQQGGELLIAELHGLKRLHDGWRVVSNRGSIETAHVVIALGPGRRRRSLHWDTG